MYRNTRRMFLGDVGRGMLVAGLGTSLATDLGVGSLEAGVAPERLHFGSLEPLVGIMQDTPADKLLPILVGKIRSGTDLPTLITAAALANTRTFGGEDYIGFHSFMALSPSLHMASQMPKPLQALPVLKVIHRNTTRMQDFGGSKSEVLHEIEPADLSAGDLSGERLREAVHKADIADADRTFAAIAQLPPGEAFNHLQFAIQDEVDVHRVVLAWRAWDMLPLAGQDRARDLLRQSVHYCVRQEKEYIKPGRTMSPIRTQLPKLLDQYKLLSSPIGTRVADDAWVEKFARLIYGAKREQAADAVAAALKEGIAPDSIAESLVLAANLLVLHDPGRTREWPGKPIGSVHGDSVGVHASDAANAWRNIVKVSNPRNTVASLIVGGYHTAGQSGNLNKEPYPYAQHLEKIKASDPAALLKEAEGAIRAKDQPLACAAIHRYSQLDQSPQPVFDLMLRYGVSEDGSLHAEKYYRTVSEEFARGRPAFRWGQLVALARVTASEYGNTAAGYEDAKRLLTS